MGVATKPALRSTPKAAAYGEDFYTWTQEQAALLLAGDFAALDRENLAEEIACLGRSEFNTLVSAWRIGLLHMLKFDHQPDKRTRSWAISIASHRDNADVVLKDNPGLKSRLDEALARAYRGARMEASQETELPLKRFPSDCPYTLEEMQTRPFAIDPDDTP